MEVLCLKLLKIQKCDALAHHPDKLEKRKKYIDETHKKLILKKEVILMNENKTNINCLSCIYDDYHLNHYKMGFFKN